MKEKMIQSAADFLLGYLSDIVKGVLPDNPDEKTLNTIQNSALAAYGTAKGFGRDIVESTENEIDDKALEELIESCEITAEKYDFSLDATTW